MVVWYGHFDETDRQETWMVRTLFRTQPGGVAGGKRDSGTTQEPKQRSKPRCHDHDRRESRRLFCRTPEQGSCRRHEVERSRKPTPQPQRLALAAAFVCGETYRTSRFTSLTRTLRTFADQFR